MLKFVYLIFLFVFIGGCTANKPFTQKTETGKQHPDLLNYDSIRLMGIDLIASGNEPFWMIDMDSEDSTTITFLSAASSVRYKTPVPVIDSISKTIKYTFNPDVTLTLFKEICINNISSEVFGFKASLNIYDKTYTGCGKYIIASVNPFLSQQTLRLNDLWALRKFRNQNINPKSFKEGVPVLELHLNDGRFLGNTNCNTIMGGLDVGDSNITFSDFTLTNKLCEGDFEPQYIQDLKSIDSWSLEKMQLTLKCKGKEILVYNKID